jgi:2-oxoglutarate dehydrogenase E2 component (dihydrolipoamide succinyltransferase)
MATPIVMPQMGESIAEGTIVRWIKKVGDQVERDEPLFEITTDKVDAEIPAPAAGVLSEIKVKEGETVAVNTVVGTIGQAGEAPAAEAPREDKREQGDGSPARTPNATTPSASAAPAPAGASPAPQPQPAARPAVRPTNGRQQRSSPLVRRIARDNNVDIGQISGSGIGGRVTKHDILEFLGSGPQAGGVGEPVPTSEARRPKPEARIDIQPLSPMRKKIAEHMVLSKKTSAHVHSVFHVDFSHVERIRRDRKEDYLKLGARLTYMAFIAKAVVDGLRRHPIINASLDGENVVLKKDVNLGIAVALDTGLIVPVISNADERNLLGLSRAIADVADRARAKQLKPEEVHGGTFTITNPGHFGAQFGMPIINQPQVAILGVGTIEKRPVVIDDAIAIRTMAYLTLGFDHRLVDGAVADEFMSEVKKQIETFDINQV